MGPKVSLSLFFCFAITAVIFQNCGTVNFSTKSDLDGCTSTNCDEIAAGAGRCSFNGVEIEHLGTVTAYQNSAVSVGQSCQSEIRKCNNGVLSGTYQFALCTAGTGSQSCLFNGQTVAHGQSIQAFLNSSVASGQTCTSQARVCNNGTLSGTYPFASCQVGGAASCLFNGQTIASGFGVFAFQNSTVRPGQICQNEYRVCLNGVLSGSFGYGSCSTSAPASCLFNGVSIASGQTVTGFQNSSVAYGQVCASQTRLCTDGVLSGQYTHATCEVGLPAACSFNGQSIASGQVITAYQKSTVPFGEVCASETRACMNGALSGTFGFGSCAPAAPAACTFEGRTIASGQTVIAFQNSSVAAGSTCVQETRTCTNGSLSGSYTFGQCSVAAPVSCTFNGQTVASGASVMAFQASSVPFGSNCISQSRVCNNGALSGSYTFASCTPNVPLACSFNGQTVSHGGAVTAYSTSSVPFGGSCASEARSCHDGVLSGSYSWGSCVVGQPAACYFQGQTIAHGQNVVAYSTSSVAYNGTCAYEARTCSNGTLSGSYAYSACQKETPSELWTWLPQFYQTTCPYYCDGMQQVRCEGTGCPGRTYWHYGASGYGVAPYTPGAQQTSRPSYIGTWFSQQID